MNPSHIAELLKELETAKDRAQKTYVANDRQPYEAGVHDGLKQALELVVSVTRHWSAEA